MEKSKQGNAGLLSPTALALRGQFKIMHKNRTSYAPLAPLGKLC